MCPQKYWKIHEQQKGGYQPMDKLHRWACKSCYWYFLGVIVTRLEEEYEIAIANYFGIFKQARVSRTGRNPKTDEAMAKPHTPTSRLKLG